MAINFSIGDVVRVKQSYVNSTLRAINSPTIRGSLGVLGALSNDPADVTNVGNTAQGKSFIQVVTRNRRSSVFKSGRGVIVYFDNDTQLNNTFEDSTAFYCDNICKVVRNTTGSTIPKGSVVRLTGYDTTNQVPLVDLADATSPANGKVFGITEENILNNRNGSCVVDGAVNADTSGFSGVGADVFLSDTPGMVSSTAGSNTIVVGNVHVVSATVGAHSIKGTSVGGSGGGGTQGSTGIQGIQGNTGVGIQGTTGIAGPGGMMGDTGVQGMQGDTGIQGIQGETGVAGIQGDTGIQGIQGDTGVAGIQGDTGINGNTGVQGLTGVIGDTGLVTQGDTGIAGNTGIAGPGGMMGATGVAGMMGDTGISGVTGMTGDTGIQGLTGVIGDTGLLLQGDTGIAGNTGVAGAQGATGVGGGASGGLQVLATVDDVDATVGASSIPVYSVPGGMSTVVNSIVYRMTGADGITTDLTASAGWDPNTTNVFAPATLTSVDTVNDIWTFDSSAKAVLGTAGATLLAGLTGMSGNTGFFSIDVIGYEF